MSKIIIRFTIVGVAIYLFACYAAAVLFGINIWSQSYYLLFELCVCLCISEQGVYHCKFIKWTAYGILASDALVWADQAFDLFPVSVMVMVPPSIIAFGLSITTTLAIKHYIKVRKLKRRWEKTRSQSRQYSKR